MDLENKWLTTLGLITSSLIAITSNFLLLLVFCRRRGLRTVSNRFVINLLFINLLSGIILLPFMIIDRQAADESHRQLNVTEQLLERLETGEVIYEKESSSVVNGTYVETDEVVVSNRSRGSLEIIETNISVGLSTTTKALSLCRITQFSLTFICTASILSILLIGIDQYLAVLHPLRCHSYMNKTKSSVMILVTWGISAAFAAATTGTNTNASYFPNICDAITDPNYINFAYTLTYFSLIIVVPFITICLIYVLIYRAAHKNSSRIRKRTNVVLDKKRTTFHAVPSEEEPLRVLPKVHSAPNFAANELLEFSTTAAPSVNRVHSERVPRNLITSLKSKFSNASVFRYREESRTAKISVLVIFMVLVCYAPYGVIFVANAYIPHCATLRVLNSVALLLLASSSLLSPVLFAYRNRRVQRELKKFLTTTREREPIRPRPRIVVNHIETDLGKSTECDVAVPEVVIDCRPENEKKSILKRVCSKTWTGYSKKCSFINVPDGCLDARGSFSSASTQISTED